MREGVLRGISHEILGCFGFFLGNQLVILLRMSLQFPELLQKLIMHQDLDVFHVVICLIGAFEFSLRLSRVDTFQNTKAPEIFE